MAKIRFITLEKLLEMMENGETFTLVDTLDSDSFEKEHIPGAINIPSGSILPDANDKVDSDSPVVTYCAGYTCEASTIAARKLVAVGHAEVFDFKGGLKLWQNAGLELESGSGLKQG